MHTDLGLLGNLAASLVVATLLGVFASRLKLSPIIGYIAAGIILGPQTPGFVGDASTASELAEIGVILLMFGVGLHFNLEDLLAVRWVAFPGAVAQFVVATSIVLGCVWLSGLPIVSGLVLGVAVSIASTVVVTRVLMDSDQLNSPSGHVAVGWLIAQDIFTVLVIVAMPAVGELWSESTEAKPSFIWSLAWALMQVIVLCSIVLVFGKFSIPWILRQVARTRSRELFTLTILSLAIAIAVGSSAFFGVSMALGAFLGGMVVGQTEASHQAAADALPMRDAFAVLFFVSVGMQFDQRVFVQSPGLLLTVLLIVMVVNPLTAFTVAWWARYSVSTSISVAILLSQIGEFSFLLADLAVDQKLLSDELRSVLVASSIISIALNPIIFRLGRPLEMQLRKRQSLWRALSRRSEREGALANSSTHDHLEAVAAGPHGPGAVIVGYGPVGQTAYRLLFECGIRPVVVDLNLDTIRELKSQGIDAIYGDAGNADILEAANIRDAKYLLVTIPEMLTRSLIILTAKNLNPELQIFVRARYIRERIWLEEVGANRVITEEGETAVSLAVRLLEEMGAEKDQIRKETRRIQSELGLNGEN